MAAVCIGILLSILLADLGIKYYIEKHLPKEKEIPLCKGRILVRHVHNEGMALNFLEKYPWLVKWMSFCAVVFVGIYYGLLFREKGREVEKISLSLVLGGALSNLYDRFARKYVVDYVGFRMKGKEWSDITYNLGDMGIFAGAIGIILYTFFGKSK